MRVFAASGILACVTVLSLLPRPLEAQIRREDELTVRVYNTFAFSGRDVVAAQQNAGEILAFAGVPLQWRTCRTTAGPSRTAPDPCLNTLHPMEVMVRIVTGPDKSRGAAVLGYSLIDMPTRTGTLSTLYGDRVRQLADRAGIKVTALLGQAIAHEVGHLLLGSSEHANEGLMRAHWLHTEIRVRSARDWQFTAIETGRMRAAVLARAHANVITTALGATGVSGELQDSGFRGVE